jgi:polysaccharide export outer membrane protein
MPNRSGISFAGKSVASLLAIAAFVACGQGLAQAVSGTVSAAPVPAVGAPSATPPSLAPTSKDAVLIGPGNSLHVLVYDEPGLEQRVTVSDEGNANFFLVGSVHVAGMTANQLARTMEGMLGGHYLVHPNVNVTIEQSATMQVSVLGEVHAPGVFEINSARNILEVISLAGGLTDAADRNITIQHGQGKGDTVTVFMPNNADDAIAKSAMVYPGDTVIVPKAGIIYVLGDVNRPGGYYMQRDSKLSVLQAVGLAGGLQMTAAAPKSRIVRKDPSAPNGYVDIPLELRAIQNGKQKDMPLQADDVIYVPFSYARNFLMQSNQILASATSAVIYTHP